MGQISCVAIESTFLCDIRMIRYPQREGLAAKVIIGSTLNPVLVEYIILAALRRRSGSYRPSDLQGVSRWWAALIYPFLTSRLTVRAADGLDRFEVPFFGGLASSFVDSE